jgi:hypothetical protein
MAESSGWTSALSRVPLFVVISARTGGLGEAAAHVLRQQRNARVIGAVSKVEGRVLIWHDLPWQARWGFTVAESIGVDGKSLRSRPVIPDICHGETGFVALGERTMLRYRERCREIEGPVEGDVVIDQVIRLLDKEEAASGEQPEAGAEEGKEAEKRTGVAAPEGRGDDAKPKKP